MNKKILFPKIIISPFSLLPSFLPSLLSSFHLSFLSFYSHISLLQIFIFPGANMNRMDKGEKYIIRLHGRIWGSCVLHPSYMHFSQMSIHHSKALHSFCFSHVKMETMLSIFHMKWIGMICQKVKPNHSSLAQAERKSLISGLKTYQNLVWVYQSRGLRTVEILLQQDLSTNIDEEMGEINTGNVVSLSLSSILLLLMNESVERKVGWPWMSRGLRRYAK